MPRHQNQNTIDASGPHQASANTQRGQRMLLPPDTILPITT
jgi:hypothetical protein